MNAVYGVLLVALSVVLHQFAYSQHRRPNPAAWTRAEMASQLICLATMAALGSGLGLIVHYFAKSKFADLTALNYGEFLAIVVVTVLVVAVLRRQLRQQRAIATPAGP